jgi:DNA-binding CsgD family transcriptional regulator
MDSGVPITRWLPYQTMANPPNRDLCPIATDPVPVHGPPPRIDAGIDATGVPRYYRAHGLWPLSRRGWSWSPKGLRMYQGPVSDDYQAISSLVLGRVDVPRPSAPSAAPPTAIPRPTEQPAGSTARASLAVSVGRLAAARSGWTVIRAELLEAKKHDQLASIYECAAALAPPALGRHRRRRAQHHRDVAQARHSTVDRALAELATITGQSGQPCGVAASMDSSVTGTTTAIRSPQRAGRRRGPATEPHAPATAANSHEHPPALVVPVSSREMEVLRRLPSELTAAEIGAELYVSINTVKAHMRSIYRKLGVGRRREAIIQARNRGLL